jgi:osmoprotectant transport system permease protein
MDIFQQALNYAQGHSEQFWKATGEHLRLSLLALAIAIVVCVPLGIVTSRFGRAARITINVIGIGRVIPSIAVLLALYPVLGLGFTPALIALTLLAFPPVLINTDAGLRGVDPATIEAARGMGMTTLGRLWQIELPLALPVLVGGIRTACVEVIASATLASFIGGGGYGDFIFQGLGGNSNVVLLVGAVPVALLAFTAEILLSGLQRLVSPGTFDRLRVAVAGLGR